MQAFPLYPERTITDLNGIWQFRFCEKTYLEDVCEENFEPNDIMCVPGTFDTTPAYRCKRGTGLYRREFLLTKDSPRGILKVGAIGLRARFRIDGREVGFTNLPYSGVEFETGPLKAGRHVITAAIDNNFDKISTQYGPGDKMKLFLPYYDFYAFGGFYRGISLHQVFETAIDRVQVRPLCIETGKVSLRFLFSGSTEGKQSVRFRFDTETGFRTIEVGHGETIECTVPDFRLWTLEKPELHTVEVHTACDCIVERFGIRTIKAGKKQILLNGKPVYLKGFNRHESHPEFGAATPEAVMLEDLRISAISTATSSAAAITRRISVFSTSAMNSASLSGRRVSDGAIPRNKWRMRSFRNSRKRKPASWSATASTIRASSSGRS